MPRLGFNWCQCGPREVLAEAPNDRQCTGTVGKYLAKDVYILAPATTVDQDVTLQRTLVLCPVNFHPWNKCSCGDDV